MIESYHLLGGIIEKLPPSWRDLKNYLKHKRKKMGLEDLILRLRINEDNRASERKTGSHLMESKENVVEDDTISTRKGSNLDKVQTKETSKSSCLRGRVFCATSRVIKPMSVAPTREKEKRSSRRRLLKYR